MIFFTFIAGFFRQNAEESSTRLVGIFSMLTGLALGVYMVVAQKNSPNDIAILASFFANGLIALGLRKAPESTEITGVAVVTPTTPAASR